MKTSVEYECSKHYNSKTNRSCLCTCVLSQCQNTAVHSENDGPQYSHCRNFKMSRKFTKSVIQTTQRGVYTVRLGWAGRQTQGGPSTASEQQLISYKGKRNRCVSSRMPENDGKWSERGFGQTDEFEMLEAKSVVPLRTSVELCVAVHMWTRIQGLQKGERNFPELYAVYKQSWSR